MQVYLRFSEAQPILKQQNRLKIVQLTHERAWVKLAWTHSASEKEEDEVKPRENASLLAIFRGAAYLKATKPIKDSANREENKINPFIFYPEVPRIFSNLAKDSATDAWASMSQACLNSFSERKGRIRSQAERKSKQKSQKCHVDIAAEQTKERFE